MLRLLLQNIKKKCNDVLQYVNAKDSNGDTPLMWAINKKHSANVKPLISVGNTLFNVIQIIIREEPLLILNTTLFISSV